MMDTTAIATAVTGCLVPALPYLIKAGEQGAEAFGEKLGSGVWETAKAIWQILSPVAETQPAVAAAVQEVVKTSDDTEAQAALRFQLKKLLAADDRLAADLAQLLAGAEPATSQGDVRIGSAESRGR